jgi:hypothetical protein
LIELKIGQMEQQGVGQMEMFLRTFDGLKRERTTILAISLVKNFSWHQQPCALREHPPAAGDRRRVNRRFGNIPESMRLISNPIHSGGLS